MERLERGPAFSVSCQGHLAFLARVFYWQIIIWLSTHCLFGHCVTAKAITQETPHAHHLHCIRKGLRGLLYRGRYAVKASVETHLSGRNILKHFKKSINTNLPLIPIFPCPPFSTPPPPFSLMHRYQIACDQGQHPPAVHLA